MSALAQPVLRRLTWFAAGLSGFASVLHGVVTPEHFDEWWGYGAFFVVAAVAQMLFAVVLLIAPWSDRAGHGPPDSNDVRAARALYLLGAAGTGTIVALYVVTRTFGIPYFGPEAGEVEAVGIIDVFSKAAELALIGVLLRMYHLAGR